MSREFPSMSRREVAPSPAPKDPDVLIKEIDFILDNHESLREKWEETIGGLPLPQQLERLEELATKRREVLAPKPYLSPKLVVLEKMPEKTEALFTEAFQALQEGSQEVGRGRNGKIMEYILPDQDESNVVYKILIRAPIGKQNDLLSEASYLADLYALSQTYTNSKIGVPRPFYCATLIDARVLAMEKVPAVSIETILEKKLSIPPGLDIDMVEAELDLFVERINNEGFYHNDLKEGNIMIDLERTNTALPLAYVIDTGNAEQVYGKGTHEREVDNKADRVMLKQAIKRLRDYKTRQEKGVSV